MRDFYRIVIFRLVVFIITIAPLYQQDPIVSFNVVVHVTSDTQGQLNNAVVELVTSSGYMTTQTFNGYYLGNGDYQIVYPPGVSPSFNLNVSASDHESVSQVYNSGWGDNVTVNLLYNNYHDEFNVSSEPLIENFGTIILEIDQTVDGDLSTLYQDSWEFLVPGRPPGVVFDPDHSNRHYSISEYGIRKDLYLELLEEIVLQTAARNSNFASTEISNYIIDNPDLFNNGDLDEISDATVGLASAFGTIFKERLGSISNYIKSAGIIYSLHSATQDGLTDGILLFAAYQAFQWQSYSTIKKKSLNSFLYNDSAYKYAVESLESLLEEEQTLAIEQLVHNMQMEALSGAISKIVIESVLTKALAVSLHLAGVGSIISTAAGFLFADMVIGLSHAVKMNGSMILLAQIDHHVLSEYSDKYFDNIQDQIKSQPDYYYGTMMRLHTGVMFNETRSKYIAGESQGISIAFLNALFSYDQFARRMVDVSDQKKAQASIDYFLISSMTPGDAYLANAASIGFIIDSSGSMDTTDPDDMRKTAAEIVVDNRLDNTSDVFIVDFDESATWVNSNNWHNWSKESVLNNIRHIDSSGSTSLESGLNTMRDALLASGTDLTNCSVMLLTDGKGDYYSGADWYAEHFIPVHTVSFVGEVNESLLTDIALQTGGTYMRANSPLDVIALFNQFYNLSSGGSRMCMVEGQINQDDDIPLTFTIDGVTDNIMVNTGWQGSRIDLELIAPNGQIYNHTNGKGKWTNAGNFITVLIESPPSGIWQANLYGTEIPPGGELFNFEVNGKNDLSYKINSLIDSTAVYNFLSNHEIICNIPELVKSTEYKLSLTPPGKSKKDISQNINNSIFNFIPQDGAGVYKLDLIINGVRSSGEPFSRHLKKQYYIGDYKPLFIAPITEIISNNYVHTGLGRLVGNSVGITCYVYSDESLSDQSLIGNGIVTVVTDKNCTIRISQYNSERKVRIGDIVTLDEGQWKSD